MPSSSEPVWQKRHPAVHAAGALFLQHGRVGMLVKLMPVVDALRGRFGERQLAGYSRKPVGLPMREPLSVGAVQLLFSVYEFIVFAFGLNFFGYQLFPCRHHLSDTPLARRRSATGPSFALSLGKGDQQAVQIGLIHDSLGIVLPIDHTLDLVRNQLWWRDHLYLLHHLAGGSVSTALTSTRCRFSGLRT